MLKDFREFIAKGNVLDLAVAVIIGAAFAKIVTSLTDDIIMPVVGKIFGGLDFSSHFLLLGPVPADPEPSAGGGGAPASGRRVAHPRSSRPAGARGAGAAAGGPGVRMIWKVLLIAMLVAILVVLAGAWRANASWA